LRSTRSRCMIAIWPAGPPKLMKPSFTQYRNASQKPTVRTDFLMAFDREVVELDDRVGFGPEADPAGILESVVRRVQDFRPVEPDYEVVSRGFELERVPGVLGHLDRLVLECPATARDRVVDGAIVLIGIAPGDVVVVGILVAPDHAESLVHIAGDGPCS